MAISDPAADALAGLILRTADAASSIPPISDADQGFDLGDAYRVAAAVIRRRMARGERPAGWKIGFTNRTIWDEYGVRAPIWGPMYQGTVEQVEATGSQVPAGLTSLVEPRIEPEIVLRIAEPPDPAMNARELLDCIDAVGHGFEIVQSLFPGWRFRAADTVAAFALHGRYFCGPLVPLPAAVEERAEWFTMLHDFAIALYRDGLEVDRGVAANVLDGPLFALAHLVRGLAEFPLPIGLKRGDIVTTGTITRAFPVEPGQSWRSEVTGLPVPGLHLLMA
jgi:2-keto-4-pentenoate hydratase